MKHFASFWALAALSALAFAEEYQPAAELKEQPGVPKGDVLKFTFAESKVFPGTTRQVTVYVPRQYVPEKPACVWVNQDGVQNNAPVVFDNLIAKGEMPVTVYVAASPGVVPALDSANALDRYNRSFEYDGLGDRYARFVLEELLPFVERQKTTDGRAIRLSKSGNDRCIGGSSSGAVCAFTAAWERPDEFRRVFSTIGTYVGLRGADRYPTLVRKTEPKPLRVYLQDGSADQNIYGGDWWMANQMMERALKFAGYEVEHAWGTEGHNGKHAAAIFPDAVRWLWKDWPKEPVAGKGSAQLNEILIPGESWQPGDASAFGSTGKENRALQLSVEGGPCPGKYEARPAKDGWQIIVNGKPGVTVRDFTPSGITVSPDHSLLYVADGASHWVHSYRIEPDGSLSFGQRYYHLHEPDDGESAGAGAMAVDRDGRLYVATALGVQVCDQAGRVNCILATPGAVTDLTFGGAENDTLVVRSGGKVLQRRLKVKGAPSGMPPVKPAKPRL